MNSHWNLYWESNHSGSFGSEDPEWYHQKIIPQWMEVFLQLDQHSNLLDLATGNGAVTRLALSASQETSKDFHIDAIDQATTQAIPGVHLLTPSPLEKIELEENHYDMITSQFGLEYANIASTLPRLAPALKSTGSIDLIAHHFQSVISQNSKQEVEQYQACFKDNAVFSRLKKLIIKMGEIRSPEDLEKSKAKANNARQSFNKTIARLTKKYPQGIVIAELMKNIEPLFKQALMQPINTKLAFIDNIETQMKMAKKRLTDQLSAALSEKDINQWEKYARQSNLKIDEKKLICSGAGQILAWHLRFTKN